MKTTQRDDKHYIEGKIVMLPTKISTIHLSESECILESASETGKNALYKTTPQHLYFVCNLPIQEGEWFISEIGELWQHNGEIQPSKWSRKVIATTDYNLHQDNRKPLGIWINLPQFSKPFIKEFIERQGKDVDVFVEVVDNTEYNGFSEQEVPYVIPDWQIKLNSDNTVNLIFK